MSYENTTNLIVNYLPQTLTDEEFRSMFQSIGQLKSSKIVRDRATGYSYGFGFVDFVKEEDALRAIQTLNGLQLQNKRIKVAYSRSGDSIKGANLYISNIPKNINQGQLEEIFAEYGTIIQCRILVDQATGRSKGVGFVLYNERSESEAAIKSLDGHTLEGATEPLSVKYADDNKGKARPPPVVQSGVPVVQHMGKGRARGGFNQFNGGGNFSGGYGAGRGAPYGAFGGGYAGETPEVSYGMGNGRGGYAGGGRGGFAGAANGGGYGPMRNQNRFNRYNPMAANNYNSATPAGSGTEEGGFTLFVYNIGPQADERELWQLFSPFGTIQKVNVIRDHSKNQGKGYGFVTMTSYPEAMSAIQGLDGYRYVGKPLQVSFKTPKA
ncbi:hypothetical protein LSH36_471g06036 [Paralvinella palmiformis]|uniref:RRM domain-containing protein n=1 Tax=Paralvinella palmiformis TaxID=53620 RepID=A0AAD9J9C6_9ANNE|nr:hypothetical protein LSH36_471g06036 [Paralvinella palmiformis]